MEQPPKSVTHPNPNHNPNRGYLLSGRALPTLGRYQIILLGDSGTLGQGCYVKTDRPGLELATS